MYHSQIHLPETHPDYPSVCAGDRHRVIVCREKIQYILQKRKGKQWHNQSFYRHWDLFRQRHGDLALPNGSPMLLQHEIDHLSRSEGYESEV